MKESPWNCWQIWYLSKDFQIIELNKYLKGIRNNQTENLTRIYFWKNSKLGDGAPAAVIMMVILQNIEEKKEVYDCSLCNLESISDEVHYSYIQKFFELFKVVLVLVNIG